MPTRSLPAILIGLLVLLGACNGSDGEAEDRVASATAVAVSATSDADDPESGATAPADTGTTRAATPTPDPAESIGVAVVDRLLSSALSASQRDCALSRLRGDPDLVERAMAASDGGEPVALEDQTELVVIAFDCAPEIFAGAFTGAVAIDSIELPPGVVECFVLAMGPENPAQRQVILGLAALGNDQAAPSDAQTAVVDAMVQCFPASFFGAIITAEALADPTLAQALDPACIDEGFGVETMRPLWELLVQNPELDFEALDPAATGPLVDAVFDCLSFGRIIAGQAATAGVAISDSTVRCIDERLESVDLLAEVGANGDTSATRDAVVECLTPDEREAMGG